MQGINFCLRTGHMKMNEAFHRRLKRLRERANLSTHEMAKLIGVAQSTYSDWEHGRGLRPLPYQEMSQVLAISVTELITGMKPNNQHVIEELNGIEAKIREIKTKLSSVS